jgi:hypothetical protein
MIRVHNCLGLSFLNTTTVFFVLLFGCSTLLWAQEPVPNPNVGFGVTMTGPGGLYAYAPNRWGLLHVNATNNQQVPIEIISATYFDNEPSLQYGRKIWLPPRSRLQTWHPIRIPEMRDSEQKRLFFHSLVMDASAAREVLIRTESGQMQHDGFLQITRETVTGAINDLGGEQPSRSDEAMELIGICRSFQKLSRSISTITDSVFAPGEESFDVLDQLIICDNRPMRDAAGLEAIRHWLFAGGHAWVMLDQADPAVLEMLLGDEFQCEIVDRVSLNTVRIETGPAGPRGTDCHQEFERPVEMVRAIVSNADVIFTVNEWPAAFWMNCGEGRLLVTTLGARGWTQPPKIDPAPAPRRQRRSERQLEAQNSAPSAPQAGPNPERDPSPPAVQDFGPKVPTDPLSTICMEFWAPRKVKSLTVESLEPIVQEYVGYAIPSRSLIVGLLAGFCGLLVVAGIGLWRINRLEWLGVVGPILAFAVSLVLVGLGQAQRQSVPPTTASIQYIQAIPGTDEFLAEGQIGFYTPDPGIATLGFHSGGRIMPEMTGLESTTRRLIWTDSNQGEWKNLPSTAGSRGGVFQTSGELDQRVSATAMFGPDGLTGELQTGGANQAADALIATANGRIGVTLRPDGSFTALSSNVFSQEQFLDAELLSDEQDRRRRVLKQLLINPKRLGEPPAPTLLFWSEPWDLGFEFPEGSRRLGAALVAVKLDLRRPPAGTTVSIPAPLLSFKVVRGPDGTVPTGLWDQIHQEWAEKSAPSSTWVRYQVPSQLLPLKPQTARIQVRVSGPIGKLEISGMKLGRVVPLKKWIDPVGAVELTAEGDALSFDATGGILFRVAAGDPDRPELTRTETSDGTKTNYWRIESLKLELKAQTTEI